MPALVRRSGMAKVGEAEREASGDDRSVEAKASLAVVSARGGAFSPRKARRTSSSHAYVMRARAIGSDAMASRSVGSGRRGSHCSGAVMVLSSAERPAAASRSISVSHRACASYRKSALSSSGLNLFSDEPPRPGSGLLPLTALARSVLKSWRCSIFSSTVPELSNLQMVTSRSARQGAWM